MQQGKRWHFDLVVPHGDLRGKAKGKFFEEMSQSGRIWSALTSIRQILKLKPVKAGTYGNPGGLGG